MTYIDDCYVEEEKEYIYEEVSEEVNRATNTLIKNVLSELDYDNKDYEYRKDIINKIFEKYGEAINTQFQFYQESNLNKYINKLYYDKITRMFNILDNYLLFSDSDVEKTEYKYYKDDDFRDVGVSEVSLEAIIKNELRSGDNVEKQARKFYDEYNHADYTIKKIEDDVKDNPYAQEYIKYNKLARDIVENPEKYNYDDKQISIIKKAIGYKKNNSIEIDKDVIAVVKAVKKYIYLKSPLKESESIDWDMFDYDNKDHVLAMLRFEGNGGFDTDLHALLYDFNEVVRKTYFTDTEKKIIRLLKEDKTQTDMAKLLDVSVQYINSSMNRIADKIKNTYWDDYEDWYYTYICKGSYKKCNSCGETKLIKHFGNDSRNKDGKKSICKSCDSKRK